jgi:hypothetical protein|tara:strand:+ start:280 stop:537 length:258 start_codon:yes stop_codon:yes gene_type:complete
MVDKMKVFAVITVARQISGEYVFIRTEKAFEKASKADKLLKKLKSQYSNEDGTIKPIRIDTPQGTAECMCEVGAFELEVVLEKDA